MTQPSAKIILDSINQQGNRITTMEVVMHRFVLAEFNTHRVFSRNSASSRAIPAKKMIRKAQIDPAEPVIWPHERQGMQGGLPFNQDGIEKCQDIWDEAREDAIDSAQRLVKIELHKSLTNRLIEPFLWHTVIVTSTEWDNFFWQRCHPDAQPEMKAAADAMQLAYYKDPEPKELAHGMWHLPYINKQDEDDAYVLSDARYHVALDILQKVSVARCARVSYLTHDGVRSLEKDLELYDKLRTSGHWSPFEHVATPITDLRDPNTGNFTGWKQYRKLFNGENGTAFIPNHPELLCKKVMTVEVVEEGQADEVQEPNV